MFINARLFFYMTPNKVDRAFRRYQLLTSALLQFRSWW